MYHQLQNKRFFSGLYQMNSGLLLFLLNYFSIEVNESQQPIVIFISVIATLSLFAILCLFNIILYYTILYAIENYNIESKLPKFLLFFINRYKKTTKFFILLEVLLGSYCLISIFVLSIMVLKNIF
jgi:hypothetical protein